MICEIKLLQMQSRKRHVRFSFLNISRVVRGILLNIWIIITAIEGYNSCDLCLNFRKNVLHITCNTFIPVLKVAGKNFWLVYKQLDITKQLSYFIFEPTMTKAISFWRLVALYPGWMITRRIL